MEFTTVENVKDFYFGDKSVIPETGERIAFPDYTIKAINFLLEEIERLNKREEETGKLMVFTNEKAKEAAHNAEVYRQERNSFKVKYEKKVTELDKMTKNRAKNG